MNDKAQNYRPTPTRQKQVRLGLLALVLVGLVGYKLVLPWTPLWADLSLAALAGLVFLTDGKSRSPTVKPEQPDVRE